MTKFSVATNRRWKDQQTGEFKEETDWHNVVLWRQENFANFLTKGKQVYVEGRLQTRNYDDKDGKKVYFTEVVADDVILLSGQREGTGSSGGDDEVRQTAAARGGPPARRPQAQQPPAPAAPDADFSGGAITDDDVPF